MTSPARLHTLRGLTVRSHGRERVLPALLVAISLAVGLFTLVKVWAPAIDAWSANHELMLGGMVVASVILSFSAAMALSRGRRRLAPVA